MIPSLSTFMSLISLIIIIFYFSNYFLYVMSLWDLVVRFLYRQLAPAMEKSIFSLLLVKSPRIKIMGLTTKK